MSPKRAILAIAALASTLLVAACSQESGTVQPKVQQMKPGVRGGKP